MNITRPGEDVGHPRAVRPGVHHLRLVRRPADVHHRHRLRRRRGDVPQVVAGRHPLHRQGHHALPLRPVAGDAVGGGHRAAAAGVRPRLRLHQDDETERKIEQVAGQRRRADGHHRRSSAPRRSATTSCASARSPATATSAGSASRTCTTPTWRTTSATSTAGC